MHTFKMCMRCARHYSGERANLRIRYSSAGGNSVGPFDVDARVCPACSEALEAAVGRFLDGAELEVREI